MDRTPTAGNIAKKKRKRTEARTPSDGLTVADVARRYRVSPDRVRTWITSGALRAINRRDVRVARPSWVIPPEALAEFERGRTASPPPAPPRRRKRTKQVDYYPD